MIGMKIQAITSDIIMKTQGLDQTKTKEELTMPWACMYSLPLFPSTYHQPWVCLPFCQNMDVTSNNYLYKQKY